VLAAANPLVPNGTFIVEVVCFLVILGLLARYVLPPINRVMGERQAQIRSALEEAERGRQLYRQAQAEYEQTLAEARREARAIVEQAGKLAEQMSQEARQRAAREHDAMLLRAQTEIERSAQRAADELRRRMVELMMEATSRVLERQLPEDVQRSLVEEATAALEASS